ncbi:MAG TPA: sigma-70 family RNA polymerase sigma factor, partial [Candidatus Limnocylindrales bacterium]|nr:sigma-70 family RNA polymerase sigma factor [Candidatus Limnocylindrales bacterium]
MRRCKDGQEAAYAELVRRHRPRLYNLAYRLTNDRAAAEDVVQETFLSAFRAIERFEPRPSLAAWLNRIAIR